MRLAEPKARTQQKIIKPRFFEAYRTERDNLVHLDTAAGYIAKKAVASSVLLAEKDQHDGDDEAAWGGMASKLVLTTELIPMMVQIQGLSRRG